MAVAPSLQHLVPRAVMTMSVRLKRFVPPMAIVEKPSIAKRTIIAIPVTKRPVDLVVKAIASRGFASGQDRSARPANRMHNVVKTAPRV